MQTALPDEKTDERRRKRRSDPWQKLRDLVACEILGNSSNTNSSLNYIEDNIDVLELLDEYAIRLLLEWVCTRYGYDPYPSYLQQGSKEKPVSVFETLEKQQLYPFLNTHHHSISDDLRRSASRLLNESFVPSIELVGTLYEHVCNRSLYHNSNVPVTATADIQVKAARRMVGQFYTPMEIARFCLERYLQSDSEKFMRAVQSCNQPSWKMLDPACGTGNFLIAAVRKAAEAGCTGSALMQFVSKHIYGIELDGRAAAIARISVLLEALRHAKSLLQEDGTQILEAVLQSLRRNIVIGDSVLIAASDDGKLGYFDLVVTNPPYVSFGSRNQPGILESQRLLLKQLYPDAAEYKVRLHSVFQDLALRFSAPGGQAMLFVPDAFLTGSFYTNLRKMLLRQSQLVSISEFPESTMPGAVVGRWCVAQYHKHAGKKSKTDYSVLLQSFCQANKRQNTAGIGAIVSQDKSRFRLLFHEIDEEIVQYISQFPCLGNRLRGHTGIRSKTGQSSIISDRRKGKEWCRGIKSGAQVSPFSAQWDGTWLRINPDLLFKGGFDSAVIGNAKVMVRQTGDRLIAAVDESGLYHLNNVHSFSTQKLQGSSQSDIDPYFACALMNSSFWLYLYQLITRERSRPLAQVDIETVESMPMPPDDLKMMKMIVKLSRSCHNSAISKEGGASIAHSNRAMDKNLMRRSLDRLIYDMYKLPELFVDHIETYMIDISSSKQILTPLPSLKETKKVWAEIEEA